ncbi:RNA polymerase sigma factor SigJ [Bailinhaonella thermotolerans]|uniref:RNA polymerase sigma factor SigJ n=1 Tax=Bailinhaonella thermotolerans TaxID=1070861 RepID=UPI001F5BE1DF|nr:RNA polymerase sigma factor SigJ [Bailinhaonella thermotolerans]
MKVVEKVNRLAAEFTAARERLVGVAYGVVGTVAEAEDAAQEAWLRLQRAAERGEEIADVEGWLVVATARIALDVLRSARRRREEYVGPWLPEPLVAVDGADPADRVTLAESMSVALLAVLESLSPAERTVFVLHDVFGLPFGEISGIVGRSAAACRRLAARARAHVTARAPRFEVDATRHREVVEAFAAAAEGADLDALLRLLDPDVVLTNDGGGLVKAARNRVRGADRVARFLAGVARKHRGTLRPAVVNGWAGLVRRRADGSPDCVLALTVAGGRITAVDMVLHPEKLRRIR